MHVLAPITANCKLKILRNLVFAFARKTAWINHSCNLVECHEDYLYCHFHHCNFHFGAVLSHFEPLPFFWFKVFLGDLEPAWCVWLVFFPDQTGNLHHQTDHHCHFQFGAVLSHFKLFPDYPKPSWAGLSYFWAIQFWFEVLSSVFCRSHKLWWCMVIAEREVGTTIFNVTLWFFPSGDSRLYW